VSSMHCGRRVGGGGYGFGRRYRAIRGEDLSPARHFKTGEVCR
jgi:hypothetical protein